MYLSQLRNGSVVVREGDVGRVLNGTESVYALAMAAVTAGHSLAAEVAKRGLGEVVDLTSAEFALPVSHPDPAHLHLTGTGLTHLGSASARNAMHAKLEGAETLTDSMKMFQMGLEGGRPAPGAVGAQPEWFYKGNGTAAIAPGQATLRPPVSPKTAARNPSLRASISSGLRAMCTASAGRLATNSPTM